MISAEKQKIKFIFINPNSPKKSEKLLRQLALEKLIKLQRNGPPPQ